MKKVAVVLPVLNETENITELLQRLKISLADCDASVFIIDDGSTDGTLEKIEAEQKSNPQIVLLKRKKTKPGCMRGDALVFGLRKAVENFQPDYIVELDGDLSHQPEEIKNGLLLMETGNDIALGSKYLAQSKIEGRSAPDRRAKRKSVAKPRPRP